MDEVETMSVDGLSLELILMERQSLENGWRDKFRDMDGPSLELMLMEGQTLENG